MAEDTNALVHKLIFKLFETQFEQDMRIQRIRNPFSVYFNPSTHQETIERAAADAVVYGRGDAWLNPPTT